MWKSDWQAKNWFSIFFCGCNQSNLSTTTQTNHSDLHHKISHFFEAGKYFKAF